MSLVGLIIAASVSASNAPGPLANAELGELQCYRPDVENKTCQSTASYRQTGPGTYDNEAVIPITAEITLETHTPVVVRDDAVCGFLREKDVLAGTLRAGGEPLPPATAKPLLARLARAMAPMFKSEICTRYEPTDPDFTAKVYVAGAYRPDQDTTVKWISPDDGYTVAQ